MDFKNSRMETSQTVFCVFQKRIKISAKRFIRDEAGATAIEYGLIAAGISVAIIAVVNSLGVQLNTTFTSVSKSLANAGT